MSDSLHFVPPVGRLGLVLCGDRNFRTRVLLQFAGTLASKRIPFPFQNPAPDGACNPELRGTCKRFENCRARKEENEPLVPASDEPVHVAFMWGAKPALRIEDLCPGVKKPFLYVENDWMEMDIGISGDDFSLFFYDPERGKNIPLEDLLIPYKYVFMGPLWSVMTDSPKLVLKRLCAMAERTDTGVVLAASPDDKLLEPCMEAFAWRMEIGARYRWRAGSCEHGWELAVYDGDKLVRRKIPVIYDVKRGYIRIASRDEYREEERT